MDKLSMAPHGTPDEVTEASRQVTAELASIERDHPQWRCWRGSLGPLLYARRPDVIPPLVVRAASAEGLRAEVEQAERDHGQVRP
ncbi:MAG TPA: hypothetical protein VGS19_15360 [Streptosporangiaceae bacterium]|nr:hypothetical protein [Streptosporangiaceae bacterium]